MDLDPILLGDNPLFGIDHLSQERARERSYSLHGLNGIGEIISYSSSLGVKGWVVSTHPTLPELIAYLKNQTTVLEKISFYPILPYVQGYVVKVTEKGVSGVISDILTGGSIASTAQIIGRGAMGLMKKDFEELFRLFIDVELRKLENVNTKIVFLHDVITDVALGLQAKQIFEIFFSHVKDKHGVEVGLVTKNFPRLIRLLKQWNIRIPPIMTSFNKIGSQMNPTREACERCLEENDVQIIAMNTLAGGYLRPQEAFEYLSTYKKIKSVVVGLSSKKHADETFPLLQKYLKS